MSGKVKISPRCRARQWTTFRDAEGRTLSVRLLEARVCRAAARDRLSPAPSHRLPSTARVPTASCFSKTTLQFTDGSGLLRTT